MTTSTLDLIDWDTCLDDEPACEAPDCDQRAEVAIISLCCRNRALSCCPCAEELKAALAARAGWKGTCRFCRVPIPDVSKALEVIPL